MNSILYKTLSTCCLVSLVGSFCYGQKTELRANVYGGLFFFRGSGAASVSTVYVGDDLGYFNPTSYGRKSGVSYAFELQAQRVTRQKHLFGVGLAYENLQSKAAVDSAYYTFVGGQPTTGNVKLTSTFITLNPFVGQRFVTNKLSFDVLAGIDIAGTINVRNEANLTTIKQGSYLEKVTYRRKEENYPVDVRPRLQLNTSYNRVGLAVGYSVGLKNLYHYNNPNFATKKAYANFLRLGISYRLK